MSPSPSLHTFTVRSMEPVAIHGMVGDTATAVTYLQAGGCRDEMWSVCMTYWNWHRKRSGSKKKKSSLRSCSILNPFKRFKALCWSLSVVPLQWVSGKQCNRILHLMLLGETNQANVFICLSDSCRDCILAGGQVFYLSCCFRVWSRVPRFCKQRTCMGWRLRV